MNKSPDSFFTSILFINSEMVSAISLLQFVSYLIQDVYTGKTGPSFNTFYFYIPQTWLCKNCQTYAIDRESCEFFNNYPTKVLERYVNTDHLFVGVADLDIVLTLITLTYFTA